MMEHYARLEGSNEFFARRAAYNARQKIRHGDRFKAAKYMAQADMCVRAGGVSLSTAARVASLKILCGGCTV